MANVRRLEELVTGHNVNLTRKLSIDRTFLSYFQQERVLTIENVDSIMAFPTKSEKAAEFLTLLRTRGDCALDPFYDALVGTFQFDLADLIKPELAPSRLCSVQMQQPMENANHQMVSSQSGSSLITQVQGPAQRQDHSMNEDRGSPSVLGVQDIPDLGPKLQANSSDDNMHTRIQVRSVRRNSIKQLNKVYEMSYPCPGRVLIINNMYFEHVPDHLQDDQTCLEQRYGSVKDLNDLKKLFNDFGFEPHVHEDVDSKDMLKVIKEETTHTDHEKYGAFIVVIMSHGYEGGIYGADSRRVPHKDIQQLLEASHFPSMAGKPRIMLLQACSGDKNDLMNSGKPSQMENHSIQSDGFHSLLSSEKAPNAGHVRPTKDPITNAQDLVIISSSYDGYNSKRDAQKGTLFIQTFIEVFREFAMHFEIRDLILEIRNRVGSGGQTVTEKVTLTKKLYFFPEPEAAASMESSKKESAK